MTELGERSATTSFVWFVWFVDKKTEAPPPQRSGFAL
jgi:hypothetical protein